jgi:hypothetical protein
MTVSDPPVIVNMAHAAMIMIAPVIRRIVRFIFYKFCCKDSIKFFNYTQTHKNFWDYQLKNIEI